MEIRLEKYVQEGKLSAQEASRLEQHIEKRSKVGEDKLCKLNPHAIEMLIEHRNQIREQIREKYPKAVIILTTTILEHDKSWDDAIEEVCQSLNDSRIRHFLYTRNGSGTSGHIRIPEADEMSDELVDFIQNLDMPVWED